MAFNSSSDFKGVYASPILSSHNFLNNHHNGTGSLFDNYSRNGDGNRFNYLKSYNAGDSNFSSNYNDFGRSNGLNFDRFNNQNDKLGSNNYLNSYSGSNYPSNTYSSNFLSRDGAFSGNLKTDSLFKNESQFEVPTYLKSVEMYTPNRLNGYNYSNFSNNHCTPSRSFGTFNRPNNFSGLNNQNFNLNSSKFNLSSNKYDTAGSNFFKPGYTDDWKKNNYLKVSNSPNLRFNSQFFPNNQRVFSDRNLNYNAMNDYLSYAKNRDKLEKIDRNLNSLTPSRSHLEDKHSGFYNSLNFNSNAVSDNSRNFESALNGNFNSESYINSNASFFNASDALNNRYKPADSYGKFNRSVNRSDVFGKFNGLHPYSRYNVPDALNKYGATDRHGTSNALDGNLNSGYVNSVNRYVDARETASPSFAFTSDLNDLNLDELYDKVKEQKQQLLKLKSDVR